MPPPSPETVPLAPSRRDLAACRASLRGGSRSFFAASLLLPRRVAEPATALYAFCRQADDLIDQPGGDGTALDQVRERLDRLYDGQPIAAPADRALAAVVARHAIPRAVLDAMIEGFAWDAAGRRYEALDDLLSYATRVAGTVGVAMALLMGARSAQAVARACDLGIAMQLTNIARDVGEDAAIGRLYLPLQWMREAGLEPEAWLARPRFSPALGAVVARLLAVADGFYARADVGIAGLPLDCRTGIRAARLLYAGIGGEVARRSFDPVSGRAVLSTSRKLLALASAVLPTGRPATGDAPPAEAARFLVAAAAVPLTAPAARGFDDRIAWLVDLFQRLERRQQS